MTKGQKIFSNSKIVLTSIPHLSEAELITLIAHHNRCYFDDDDPEISDEVFDKLVEALRFINPQAEILFDIGAKPQQQMIHERPMLSLDKCYDNESFFKWAEKINGNLVAMPKIDGVASSLIYSTGGLLIGAATRGDGLVGESIIDNVRVIDDIPSSLPTHILVSLEIYGTFEVRGEIFLPISRFSEQYANNFSNPRNLAAGALKQKDVERSKSYGLSFLPYDLRGCVVRSEEEKFIVLEKLGFRAMPWQVVENNAQAIKRVEYFLAKRGKLDYEIDGVVFRANALSDQTRLGETAHHPRFALAYKFQGDSAQTELTGVEWSVSRSGAITPVALVNPVFISGASVTRASLHNLGIFRALALCEESLVIINRRGGVIPHVESVLKTRGAMLEPPSCCPSCFQPVLIAGDFLMCGAKEECEEVVVANLIHFCQVIGIEGLGEKIIRKLYKQSLLKTFKDVYGLKFENLLTVDRMGEVLARKLIAEIANHKSINLAVFIRALGIDEIGNNIAGLLASSFPGLEVIRKLSVEDLMPIHGIGERIACSLVAGLKAKSKHIDDLLKIITINNQEKLDKYIDNSHVFYNKNILFTGKMAYLDRKSAQELAKKLGAKTPMAISAVVDYLVVGEDGHTKSTKHKTAEKLISQGSSLKIISEREFLALSGNKLAA